MGRSRRVVVDDSNIWLMREFFSVDPAAGTDGTVDHGAADYIALSPFGNGDAPFSVSPALYSGLTTTFKTFVVWGKGVISFGQPTDAQLEFMATADAATDMSTFPGAFITAGYRDPNGADIFVGIQDPEIVAANLAYTQVQFGTTFITIYKDRITIIGGDGVIDLGTGVRLTSADAVDNAYRLASLIVVDGDSSDNVINGTAAAQTIRGHDGNDTLSAATGPADLFGGAGNDTLKGGDGFDRLNGGDGDDTFLVPDSTDIIIESAGGGNDTVIADLSFVLPENVEALIFKTGAGVVNGTGNGLSNTITGNDSANRLLGRAGDDILIGGAGNDLLDGGSGSDTLRAGPGKDTYYVTSIGDSVMEKSGEGRDKVVADISWTLSANVEDLVLIGRDTLEGIGNVGKNRLVGNGASNLLNGRAGDDILEGRDGDDTLFGEAGNDNLFGGAGDDKLTPGAGKDSLTGGLGADMFLFGPAAIGDAKSKGRADFIADFVHGLDVINLINIDANAPAAGDQAFKFIGKAAFSGLAGELRTEQTTAATYLAGDTDGDGLADFYIRLAADLTLSKGDFLL